MFCDEKKVEKKKTNDSMSWKLLVKINDSASWKLLVWNVMGVVYLLSIAIYNINSSIGICPFNGLIVCAICKLIFKQTVFLSITQA